MTYTHDNLLLEMTKKGKQTLNIETKPNSLDNIFIYTIFYVHTHTHKHRFIWSHG